MSGRLSKRQGRDGSFTGKGGREGIFAQRVGEGAAFTVRVRVHRARSPPGGGGGGGWGGGGGGGAGYYELDLQRPSHYFVMQARARLGCSMHDSDARLQRPGWRWGCPGPGLTARASRCQEQERADASCRSEQMPGAGASRCQAQGWEDVLDEGAGNTVSASM